MPDQRKPSERLKPLRDKQVETWNNGYPEDDDAHNKADEEYCNARDFILDELWAAVFPPTETWPPASMEQKAREWAEKMIQAPGFLSVGPNHPMRHSELSNSVFLAKQTPESMGFAQASCSRWLTAFATQAVQEAVWERDARIAELERERNRYATDLAYANASIQQLEGGAAYKSMKSQCEMATSRAIFTESSRDDLAGKVEAMERVIAEAKSALSALNSKPAGGSK